MTCHFCQSSFNTKVKLGFRESCGQCRHDLHICKNCFFYDVSAYNECRETQAERVLNKEKFNFCDFFKPRTTVSEGAPFDPVAEAKKKLEALFKK